MDVWTLTVSVGDNKDQNHKITRVAIMHVYIYLYIFSSSVWRLQRETGRGTTVEAEVEEAGAVDD